MKKRVYIITLLLFVMALLLAGCSGDGFFSTRRIHFHFKNAEYLQIDNGKPEYTIKITDKDALQKYMEEFESHRYVKLKGQPGDKYCYRLVWYDSEDQVLETISIEEENGHVISHNGKSYKVALDHNIDPELFQSFLFEASKKTVILTADKSSVSPTGLTLSIKNVSDNVIEYGAWYRLEELQDEEWKQVEPIEGVSWAQDDWKKPVEPGSQETEEYNWEWYYGRLPAGDYRIVISVFKEMAPDYKRPFYFAAEFSISESRPQHDYGRKAESVRIISEDGNITATEFDQPVTIEMIASSDLSVLDIRRISVSDKTGCPFRIWRDDKELFGVYHLYDAETLEEMDFFHPSGPEPQFFIFSEVPPGHEYIVTLETTDYEKGEDYFYAFVAALAEDFPVYSE